MLFTPPHSPSSGSGGRRVPFLLPDAALRSPSLALLDTLSPGACAALFHHSLLPSSLSSPGLSPLFSEDGPWLPSSLPHLLNSGHRCGSAVPNLLGTRDQFHGRPFFHRPGGGGWFGDDSSTLHLVCALFLT